MSLIPYVIGTIYYKWLGFFLLHLFCETVSLKYLLYLNLKQQDTLEKYGLLSQLNKYYSNCLNNIPRVRTKLLRTQSS